MTLVSEAGWRGAWRCREKRAAGIGVDDERRECRIGRRLGARNHMGVAGVTPAARLGGRRSQAQQRERRADR